MTSVSEARATAEVWRLNDLRNKEAVLRIKNWQLTQFFVSVAIGVVLTALSYAVAYLMQ